jgi:DNA polymerase-1
MPATLADASKLFREGAIELARVEANGIKIDVGYLEQAIKDTQAEIANIDRRMRSDKIYPIWRKRFGDRTNITSPDQLGVVLFDVMGLPAPATTATGKWKTDEESLATIDLPFVKDLLDIKHLNKMLATNLFGIRNEMVDGYLHPFFNLNTVRTFRGSSDSINFQNLPNRDPRLAEIVRRCFIPRKGRRFVEDDYGQLEWKGAANFWRDPEMIRYASDPKTDIHRDMAAKIFMIDKEAARDKRLRHLAKNQFVFPILYGSWFRQCCQHIWHSIEGMKIGEITVRQHLKNKGGLTSLGACSNKEKPKAGTFEAHVKKVEDQFYKQFSGFKEGKERWWKEYQERGEYRLSTGFPIKWGKGGFPSRNNLLNDPIQGPGFHCLLLALVLLGRELRRRKMRSLIVGQIHDCILGDVPDEELQEYMDLVARVMTQDVPEYWDWIVVPMIVEADVTPVNGSWYEKAPWSKVDGKWGVTKK